MLTPGRAYVYTFTLFTHSACLRSHPDMLTATCSDTRMYIFTPARSRLHSRSHLHPRSRLHSRSHAHARSPYHAYALHAYSCYPARSRPHARMLTTHAYVYTFTLFTH